MDKPQTLKGFRDFLPKEAKKRQYVINTLKQVFESFDFEPLETPALEYEEILLGKYGDEGDKLMYRFEDNGGRRVALRYDQTVPLARVVAQYQNELPMPFKRYQIQPVWRAENTQKGRFREFLQCDIDIVGSDSSTADTQVISVAAAGLRTLGFKNFTVLINDRDVFQDTSEILRAKFPNILKKQLNLFFIIAAAVDKIKKIEKDGVINELVSKGLSKEEAEFCIDTVTNQKESNRISEILQMLNVFNQGLLEGINFKFSPTLARGLNYYTSTIFEIEIDGYTGGSVCGGGRYDKLIGMFAGRNIPAVGFAYGFDRIMEAIEELKININVPRITDVLVTIFSDELQNKSLETASFLRKRNIKTELYLGNKGTSLEKQLKYADQKGIPYCIIIGPDEAKNNTVTVRNMQTREQETIPQEKIEDALQ